MKKLLFFFAIISLCLASFGQIKTVNFSSAIPIESSDLPNEVLLKLKTGYAIPFAHTPVGIKHCIEKTISILNANGFEFSSPDINDDLLATYVDDIFDYSGLHTSLSVNSSEIHRIWDFKDSKWRISLTMNEDIVGVLFVQRKE